MVNENERLLPIANVGRIMKQILPAGAKISKEAKETIQECASEFISFVTAEASDKCHKENRKTMNGDDVCWSLSSLGFDIYTEVMLKYLHKYREYERQKVLLNQKRAGGSTDEEEDEASSSHYSQELQPQQKRPTGENPNPVTFEFFVDLEKGGPSSRTKPAI